MTKYERIIDYLKSMSDYDLAYAMSYTCYMYNLYTDYWHSMGDFDEVMDDVEPSYTVKLALEAGHDFDMTDEYFMTDKVSYLYSGNAEDVAEYVRNDIQEYARLIIDYDVTDTGDTGLNSIIERGED